MITHKVDGGYEGTMLFTDRARAVEWLDEHGYRRDAPNPDTWMKPVYAEWDDERYLACPEAFEMEVAEVYEQEIK